MRRPQRALALAALILTLDVSTFARAADDPEPLLRAASYRATRTLDPKRSGPVETRRGWDGHLWVKPLVNGKEIGWFMFDSGKTGMSIDAEVAKSLGLTSAGETELYGIGGTSKGEKFVMASFDLGPWRAVNLEAETMPALPPPPDGSRERPIGVVGSYVLRDVVSVVDMAHASVSLYAPGGFKRSGIRWLPTRMRPDVPAVEVKVQGRALWLLLDTGMPGAISLFDPRLAEALGLTAQDSGAKMVAMGGDGRPLDLRAMTASRVDFAGETKQDVHIAVPAEAMAPARSSLQGLLGARILAGRTIIIDGPNKRVGLIDG